MGALLPCSRKRHPTVRTRPLRVVLLAVRPVEDGCANDYAYVNGNPIRDKDLDGKAWYNPASWDWKKIGRTICTPFRRKSLGSRPTRALAGLGAIYVGAEAGGYLTAQAIAAFGTADAIAFFGTTGAAVAAGVVGAVTFVPIIVGGALVVCNQ